MDDLARTQKLDDIINIRIVTETQNVIIGDASLLFRCQIFC